MFAYHTRLAWLSIRRNPVLSNLMICAIGVGIGACMTMMTIYYVSAKNPIPHRSSVLYHVQLDNRPIGENYVPGEEPRDQISWRDAQNLLSDARGERQAAMFKAAFAIQAGNNEIPPYLGLARMTGNAFFSMFDVPFQYGQAWPDSVDAQAAQVVVLSRTTNEKLFAGENSTGRTIRLDEREFTVTGVIDWWEMSPKFFDLTNGGFAVMEDIYLPLSLAPVLEINTAGNMNCNSPEDPGYAALLQGNCNWLSYWVELPDAAARDDYDLYLNAYSQEQQQLGLYEREPNYRLRNVAEWLTQEKVAPDDSRVLVWLSFLFLCVCLLNTVGLILAKFTGRTNQVALRRALGATRSNLFAQHLLEVLIIGLFGGLLGVVLAQFGLQGLDSIVNDGGSTLTFSMDWLMFSAALLIALGASGLAGAYPAWRVGRLAPAAFLKTQ